MNMQNLNGKCVIITGGSQGLGLAMVEALAACGANVTAISRDRAKLAAAEQAGAAVIAGDATDAILMNRVVREEVPDVLILNAGARLSMKPIDQENWDEFSADWNTDVKAGLVGVQAALNTPMKRGGRVLVMSSGASTCLRCRSSPPKA
jgi:NAD(P)-dependent dehydrogenase (short-subunit alcohol dehydrogenase family)